MKQPYSNVAIVHDVFIEFGGAERVLLELVSLYPTADIYIPLLANDKKRLLSKYTQGNIQTSVLNRVPLIHSASILLKPILFWYWQQLDLAQYDLVISSSHSFSSKAVVTGPQTTHLSYVHTPPRYLYVEYNETRILRSPVWRAMLSPLLAWLRSQDFLAAQRPDMLIANSQTVACRIEKYYRRTSPIVYPPIQIPTLIQLAKAKKSWSNLVQPAVLAAQKPSQYGKLSANQFAKLFLPGKYYVCFSRLSKQKGMDLAVQTCTQLQKPLLIVGQGSEAAHLQSLAGPTVRFVGAVSDELRSALMVNARALLYCSIEEDFGMVTAEALAHGLPVIGYESGGTKEIVTRNTGELFNNFTIESLSQAITRSERRRYVTGKLRKRANLFAAAKFRQNILRYVRQLS